MSLLTGIRGLRSESQKLSILQDILSFGIEFTLNKYTCQLLTECLFGILYYYLYTIKLPSYI